MHRRGDRFSASVAAAMLLATGLAAVSIGGCSCSCAGDRPARPGVTHQAEASKELHVGNPSRGLDQQPDYDAAAAALRERVAPRLPDPLPEVRDACAAMLAAANELYVVTEADATAQRATLRATLATDQRACEAETSAAAASCVRLLLDEQAGEWPWLLDQCSRAFPRT